jgi:hypothetical protein
MRLLLAAASIAIAMLLTASVADAAEVYLTNEPLDEVVIHVDGRIVDGDAARVIAAIDQVLNVTDAVHGIVQLESVGGVVQEALAIGYEIHRRHLPTLVHRECLSACAFAFMGGIVPFVRPYARVGFHSSYACVVSPEPFYCSHERSETSNQWITSYLRTIGLSEAAIEWMLSADPDHMNYLTLVEAERYGIAISILEPPPCPV